MKNIQHSTKKEKNILILGGGVAGLSAAGILSGHDLKVHLVEKSDRLGGNASAWACMATDACRNCGACLVPEMVENVNRSEHVAVHLNRTVTHVKKQDGKYLITLSSDADSPLLVDKVITATGFSPIIPDGLVGEKHKAFNHVITTVQLNELMAQQKLESYFSKTTTPRIGFIQCVGSRNRLKGRDYCSQVCCKISLRHINKILTAYPKAEISMFYIDLQIIGKETRSAFEALGKNVRLIQGVPFDILDTKKQDMLTLIREDKEARARIAEHFDMIVLSVGITPNSTAPGIAQLFDLKTDPWGFFINPAEDGSSGIHVAGCAQGPQDILSSKAQGEQCARLILKELGFIPPAINQSCIAVMGDGQEALLVAQAVKNSGYDTLIIGKKDADPFNKLGIGFESSDKLISVSGTANRFKLMIKKDGTGIKTRDISAIIVAEPVEKSLEIPDAGIPEDCFFSVEDLAEILIHNPDRVPDRVVFHLGTRTPPPKPDVQKALSLAVRLVQSGKKVMVIVQHMLVNGACGQRAYDQARKLGVRFFRINGPDDVTIKKTDQGIGFIIKDALLFDMFLEFEADWMIRPQIVKPGQQFEKTTKILKLQTDREGFFQAPNVRYRLTGSPRKGIFFAGTCHDDIDSEDLSQEIRTILQSVEEQKTTDPGASDSGVVINEGKCVRCLTCFRICPHSAIVIMRGLQPYVVPDACVSCGLCVSSCPALAITQTGFNEDGLSKIDMNQREVVFACERSAAIAAKKADIPDNTALITVPCVCRISTGILLKTLLKGALSITLAGCHPGNCRSIQGSEAATSRTEKTNRLLAGNGPKVKFNPIAANESVKFQHLLSPEK